MQETYSVTMDRPLENEMGLGSRPMKCFKKQKGTFLCVLRLLGTKSFLIERYMVIIGETLMQTFN